jgi:hypothetical protein
MQRVGGYDWLYGSVGAAGLFNAVGCGEG